jgi:transcription initiation factor TFIIIB Brf1 subunit/transcription initiation factor TFIIB
MIIFVHRHPYVSIAVLQRVCAAALFLACKVEEVPRTLSSVIENTDKLLRRKKVEELSKEVGSIDDR